VGIYLSIVLTPQKPKLFIDARDFLPTTLGEYQHEEVRSVIDTHRPK
jgi:hypothetical protein